MKCGNFNTKTNKCGGADAAADVVLTKLGGGGASAASVSSMPGSGINLRCRRTNASSRSYSPSACSSPAALGAQCRRRYEAALAGFTTDSFADTDSGDRRGRGERQPARARRCSRRCRTGACCSAGRQEGLHQGQADGELLDAATGKPAADARRPTCKTVRVNNRLRRAIEAALGGLTLLSPDPAKRLEAAQAVFKSRDAGALPTLDAALAKETDAARQARAERGARRGHPLSGRRQREPTSSPPIARHRASAATRTRAACSPACRPGTPRRCRRAAADAIDVDRQPPRALEHACRTSGTASRSARCCCSPRSASPSPSASWASSTWRTARW